MKVYLLYFNYKSKTGPFFQDIVGVFYTLRKAKNGAKKRATHIKRLVWTELDYRSTWITVVGKDRRFVIEESDVQ